MTKKRFFRTNKPNQFQADLEMLGKLIRRKAVRPFRYFDARKRSRKINVLKSNKGSRFPPVFDFWTIITILRYKKEVCVDDIHLYLLLEEFENFARNIINKVFW